MVCIRIYCLKKNMIIIKKRTLIILFLNIFLDKINFIRLKYWIKKFIYFYILSGAKKQLVLLNCVYFTENTFIDSKNAPNTLKDADFSLIVMVLFI